MESFILYAISDSIGETAQQVAKAAISQPNYLSVRTVEREQKLSIPRYIGASFAIFLLLMNIALFVVLRESGLDQTFAPYFLRRGFC